jgi:hypothetical protein
VAVPTEPHARAGCQSTQNHAIQSTKLAQRRKCSSEEVSANEAQEDLDTKLESITKVTQNTRYSGTHLQSQLLRRLGQEDCLSPGAHDQPEQNSETLSQKKDIAVWQSCLPTMHKALGLIPSTAENKKSTKWITDVKCKAIKFLEDNKRGR